MPMIAEIYLTYRSENYVALSVLRGPVNRLNIKTYLMIEDLMEIKKIILNEINRNGQVFYVAPRISDLDSIKKKILKTIPNIRLACIHGKLNSSQIEKIYSEFFNNNIDVLLSTAMIESGLDLSNVNTIIIEKPQLFGLSQLYQLRGRVGRSSIQAYAYLIVKNIQSLREDAVMIEHNPAPQSATWMDVYREHLCITTLNKRS